MKRFFLFWAVLAVLLPLGGCTEPSSADQHAYAILASLEYGEQMRYLVSVRLAGVDGEDEQGAKNVISVEADTVTMAIDLLNTTYHQDVHFGQLRYLFFSRALAQSGDFAPLIRELDFNPLIDPAAGIIICQDSPVETLRAVKPTMGKRLSRSLAMLEASMLRQSLIPVTSLHRVASSLNSPYGTPLGVFCALSPNGNASNGPGSPEESEGTDPQEPQESAPAPSASPTPTPAPTQPLPQRSDQGVSHLGSPYAGQTPQKGGSSVHFLGAAVFTHDRLGIVLSGYETQLLMMAMGQLDNVEMTFSTSQGPVDVLLRRVRRMDGPRIQAAQTPYITLSLAVSGDVLSAQEVDVHALDGELGALLERDLYHVLDSVYQTGCDPLNLGGQQARRYATIAQYEQGFSSLSLCALPVQVQVTVHLGDQR